MTLVSCVHFTDATTTFVVPCDLFSVLINITFFFYEALERLRYRYYCAIPTFSLSLSNRHACS